MSKYKTLQREELYSCIIITVLLQHGRNKIVRGILGVKTKWKATTGNTGNNVG